MKSQEQSGLGGTSAERLVQPLLKPGLAPKLAKADNRPKYPNRWGTQSSPAFGPGAPQVHEPNLRREWAPSSQ